MMESLDLFGSRAQMMSPGPSFPLMSLESVSLCSEASYFLWESSQTAGSYTLTRLLVTPAKVPGPMLIGSTWVM